MTLREELYELWQREEQAETVRSFKEREAKEAISQRDALLARLWEAGIQGPDASCRCCDAPMSMMQWKDQYCRRCRD